MSDLFHKPIEFLKGVGPQKGALLNKELNIFTYADLLRHFPFRYDDRTKFYAINQLNDQLPNVQVKGEITDVEFVGDGRKKRLVAHFTDGQGYMQLVWFQGIKWVQPKLKPGLSYLAFGKPAKFGKSISMAHPELEILTPAHEQSTYLQPVYSLTETLKRKYIDNKTLLTWIKVLLTEAYPLINENLPPDILSKNGLISKRDAYLHIHIPKSEQLLQKARFRLKFEELFLMQLDLLLQKQLRMEKFHGQRFSNTDLLTKFYHDYLPFELTNAQKRVIKEVFADMKSGYQMNRLLQGDVGSGKTMVAFLCALLAISSGAQAALIAPTEILAHQHMEGLGVFAKQMGLEIRLLTGSTKKRVRNEIHTGLLNGSIHILVGTHALLEEVVQFQNLGLAIVDEQHRFGVAQRAALWQKNKEKFPHVLVMTATPIPRTLSMTLYGDLDVSIIDELPKGRKPIQTVHRFDANRLRVNQFLRDEIEKGRQVYIVYPLIEESEKLDLKDLMDGYESVCRSFPEYHVSILHGRMKAEDKEFEMARFVKGETKIMVATTVIEVGVNVPNASLMVIENAERFGLSQLHQLRGRVGRGAEQSYCILMSSYKLSKEAKARIDTMIRTNDGFDIANVDLQLRGPGDMMGTRQSGQIGLLLTDLRHDGDILSRAREEARALLTEDPKLEHEPNVMLKSYMRGHKKSQLTWSRIS